MKNKSLTRRTFIKASTVSAASLMLPLASCTEPALSEKPNILLYVVDDQGSTDAGCFGNPVIKTPGLDQLAREGVRFTNAFCTSASCSASRSVILTGFQNHANGQFGHTHSYHHFATYSHIRSLPVMLEEAGYRTVSAGKVHVAPENVYHFQNYENFGNSPVDMADKCKKYISDQSESPFFLYFCTSEPHRPFKRKGMVEIDPDDVIVPSYLPDTPECRDELSQYYMSVQRADSGLLQLIKILKEAGQWDNTIIMYISDNGIAFPGAKTTLYDPGMKLPCVVRNPFQKEKGYINNAMISWADITPTLLDFAGVLKKNKVRMKKDSEQLVDWQKKKGVEFQGRSFKDILGQENPEGWDEVYASHTFHEITMYYPMRVIRTRKYKLIWNIAHKLDYPFASDLWQSATWQSIIKRGDKFFAKRAIEAYIHRPEFELYNLEADPDEVDNLADNPEYKNVFDEMKNKLRDFQEKTGDPWILKWDYE